MLIEDPTLLYMICFCLVPPTAVVVAIVTMALFELSAGDSGSRGELRSFIHMSTDEGALLSAESLTVHQRVSF